MPHFVQDVEEIRQRAIQKIEEGPVTSTYGLDQKQAIGILNEALATEIVCVLRYMHHYFMATGVHGRAAADEFKKHADAEREHADRIAGRIQQLGGKPDYNPRSLLERSVSQYVEGETLADMIREDLIAERIVIDVYRDMIRFFGNDDPTTRIMLEQILAEEEEHANDLADLLYVVNPSTGETETEDPGTEIGRSDREQRMDRGGRYPQRNQQHQRSEQNESGDRRNESRGQRQQSQPAPPSGHGTLREEEASLAKHEPSGRRDRGEFRATRAPGRERPARGRQDVRPAHLPGTAGRVMGRPGGNEAVTAADDIRMGGQSGATRSPKVVERNRKKPAA